MKKDKFKMPKWMDCAWRRVACERDNCPICGRVEKDRQRHIKKGEGPDDMKCVLEDVERNLKEALGMIKKDAERMGIDISNIDDIEEPPEPEKFPLYNKVGQWRKTILLIGETAENLDNFWLHTEAAADLFWYCNTIAAKTYRQLCNRWHLDHGDDYGEFDYEYTNCVLKECFRILKNALKVLAKNDTSLNKDLGLAFVELKNLEKEIMKI